MYEYLPLPYYNHTSKKYNKENLLLLVPILYCIILFYLSFIKKIEK